MSDEMNQTTGSKSEPPVDHKHRYPVSLTQLIQRNPVYKCEICGMSVQPVMAVRIIEKFAFYIMLAVVIFSTGPLNGPDQPPDSTGVFIAKIVGSVAFYLLVRIILAKVGKVEPVPDIASVQVELSGEQAAEQAEELRQRQEEISQEKQALIDLYKQYESAYFEEHPEEFADKPAHTQPEVVEPVCEHKLKQTWKNYVPGKQTFYCEKCGAKLYLSKKQAQIINVAVVVPFFLLLFRDMMDVSLGWGIYAVKMLIVILFMGIAQAVVINIMPLETWDKDKETRPK